MKTFSQVTAGEPLTRHQKAMKTTPLAPSHEGMSATRALSAIRLSVLTDETTSPDRQRAANEGAASAVGARIVGEAVDLGVSASKTSPFERPELGEWLTRPDEFDVLLFWRFDRAVRSMNDLSALASWAREHRKTLVFAEGPGGRLVLDFRNGVDLITQLIIQVFAFAAESEAQSIRERVNGAQAAMRAMPLRWRGSRPPYGYAPAPLEGGGWTLTPATEAVEGCGPAPLAVVERIIRELMAGSSVGAIAAALNSDNVPSPRDWWALAKGRETGGKAGAPMGVKSATHERFNWTSSVILKLLRSPSLLGWKTHQGNPVRDSEGRPVVATAEPLLTRTEFDVVGALLDARAAGNVVRRDTNALLLGVAHCEGCGGRMYLNKTRSNQAPAYKCSASSRGETCAAVATVRADWLDEYTAREFLRGIGALRVTETRFVPGYDPAPEIAATLAEFEDHQRQEGRQRSKAARDAWQRRADALDSRLAELESRERIEPRTEVVQTAQTYATAWADADTAGRRSMLLEAGAYLTVRRGTRGGWRTLDERRVSLEVRNAFFAEAAAELAALRDSLEGAA